MRTIINCGVAAGLAPALFLTSLTSAFAQTSVAPEGALRLEEIIVTAERRQAGLQDTPLAIGVLDAEAIERQPFTDFIQLGQRTPTLVLTQRLGVLQTAIRGVAAQDFSLGADPRVAFHSDGVYIARGAAQAGGLYDIERVEIVQGPQGTLYGRNATAGAINVITRAPTTDAFSGYITGTIGNYGLRKTNAAINVPVNDELSFRLVTEIIDRDGYGRNVYLSKDIDDHDSESFRGSLRWERDSVQVDIIADYYKRDDNSTASYYNGFLHTPVSPTAPPYINSQTILPSDRRDNSGDVLPSFQNESKGLTAKVTWDISDNLSLQSLSGYRTNDYHQFGDSDGTNLVATGGYSREKSDTYSQEFQLSGRLGDTEFTTGVYAFKEDIDAQSGFFGSTVFPVIAAFHVLQGRPVPPPTEYVGMNSAEAEQETSAYAIFAEVTQHFTDDLRLTLGGRYTRETKEVRRGAQGLAIPGTLIPQVGDLGGDFSVPDAFFRPEQKKTWTKFTPRLTLQYDFSADMMGYLTYAVGFKSGAYGLADFSAPVSPETLKDLEGGIKVDWLDGRLRTNFSAFYYDYQDLQVNRLSGNVLSLENAAEATAYGAQIELAAQVTENLRLNVDAIAVRTEFDEYFTEDTGRPYLGIMNLKGSDLPQSPSYKASIGANYNVPLASGDLSFNVQATFTDEYYLTAYNLDTHATSSSQIYDASVEYRMRNGFSASFWGNNLSDELVITSAFPPSVLVGNPINYAYGAPRTYGVKVSYEW